MYRVDFEDAGTVLSVSRVSGEYGPSIHYLVRLIRSFLLEILYKSTALGIISELSEYPTCKRVSDLGEVVYIYIYI